MDETARKTAPQPERRTASGVRRLDLPRALVGRPSAAPPSALVRAVPPAQRRPEAEPATTVQFTVSTGGDSATLLVAAPDQRDFVSRLLGGVAGCGAHLLECEQCLDAESGRLFLRLHLNTTRVAGPLGLEPMLAGACQEFGLSASVRRTERKKRVALFVSKYDHCLYDLLLRHRAGDLDCEIPLIISNHPNLGPIADEFEIDYEIVSKDTANKLAAEDYECSLLEERGVHLLVMARYMQILSERFVSRWQNRIINIHHSFLPAFMGAKPYHQAQSRGVKLIGATAHYITPALDQGPIIEQDVVRCSHKDSIVELTRKGRDLERVVLARALRWHLEDRIIVHGNKTIVFH